MSLACEHQAFQPTRLNKTFHLNQLITKKIWKCDDIILHKVSVDALILSETAFVKWSASTITQNWCFTAIVRWTLCDHWNDFRSTETRIRWWVFGVQCSISLKEIVWKYPDNMGEHCSVLVPNTVSYACFWARYFYRCSVSAIIQESIQIRYKYSVAMSTLGGSITNQIETFARMHRAWTRCPFTGRSDWVDLSITPSPFDKCRKSTPLSSNKIWVI